MPRIEAVERFIVTRKRRRLTTILICGIGLGVAAGLSVFAFRDSLTFFVTPSDLMVSTPKPRQIRLGGLVEQGSVERANSDGTVRFRVTDGKASVPVTYKGVLPDLFRDGQGVVVLGAKQPDGMFKASEVLAKHDETYMPKEVAEALKKSGRWNPAVGLSPPPSTLNQPANTGRSRG